MTAAADRRTAAGALLAAGLGLAGLATLVAGMAWAWAVALVLTGAAVLAGLAVARRAMVVNALVALGLASACWDAVRLGGVGLFDLLCAAGLVAVAVDLVLRRDPVRWPSGPCLIAFGLFALTTVLVALFPTDSFYMDSRFELSRANLGAAVDPGVAGAAGPVSGVGDLGGLSRLAMGLLVLPVLLGWYARGWDGLVLAGRAFAAGAAASSLVALTDYAGLTGVGGALVGYVNGENRSTGLTTQPNHLALTAVMALPFVWVLFRRWPVRGPVIVLLLAGIYVSGSRAGLIGAAVALAACLAWEYRARFLLASVPIGVGGLLAVSSVLALTRFGAESAAESDVERTLSRNQGVDDFLQSPLYGIGLRVSQEAHVVYLQVVASAGLIGALAFLVLVGAALAAAQRLRHRPVVLAAGISVLAYLVVGAATNALWTRYMFVPLVILFVAARYVAPGAPRSARSRAEIDSIVPVVETPGVRGR